MSEDFTLYRGEAGPHPEAEGTEGRAHLVAFRCAHRGAQLSTGWVEGDDLRCFYHGWKYDGSGSCIEQPAEPEPFCQRIKIRGYPVQEYLGLIFAYLGEGEPPPMRRFPDFERGFVIEPCELEDYPCNYFNRLDNASDGAHVAWTHRESLNRIAAAAGVPPRPPTAEVRISEETEYGLRSGTMHNGKPAFQTHLHMPNVNQPPSGSRGSLADGRTLLVDGLYFRVPVDDENSVSFTVDCVHLTGAEADDYRERRRMAQDTKTAALGELSAEILAGNKVVGDMPGDLSPFQMFWIEDYVAQCGQGAIADRSHEHLGRSDSGVVSIRQLWARELKALAEGRPLKQWHTPAGLADMIQATNR
ncbi:MAG: pobA 2 [Chloroflexi bacterium]|nr:pobA 2 [Chloroflexota bacterium]